MKDDVSLSCQFGLGIKTICKDLVWHCSHLEGPCRVLFLVALQGRQSVVYMLSSYGWERCSCSEIYCKLPCYAYVACPSMFYSDA